MRIQFEPIGYVKTVESEVPRHWSLSDVKGELLIEDRYSRGIEDIKKGQRIVVLFYFHKSPEFETARLKQTPPNRNRPKGVFSICSPLRPNRIGLSVLEVTGVRGSSIMVRGVDMLDGTPILDIKPHVDGRSSCPSRGPADRTR